MRDYKTIKGQEMEGNRADYFQKTQTISSFIKESWVKLVEMWECEFTHFSQSHPIVKNYMKEVRPLFYQENRKEVSTKQILEGIRSGILFGMAQVDISVPDEWPEELRGRSPHSPSSTSAK